MAQLSFYKDGSGPEAGDGLRFATLSLEECIEKLGLRPHDFCWPLDKSPIFGRRGGLADFRGYRYVVVELSREETAGSIWWRPGYYGLANTSVQQAKEALRFGN